MLKQRKWLQWWKTSGALKYWTLLQFPFRGRPAHFESQPDQPAYARRRWGLLALPLVPASLWAYANASLGQFMLERNFAQLSARLGAEEAFRRSAQIQKLIGPATTVLALAAIFAIAFIRCGYHRLARRVLSSCVHGLRPIGWRYFLMSTSSVALWLGFLAVASSWLLKRAFAGDLAQAMQGRDGWILGFMAVLAILQHWARRNREAGFREAYGGSPWWVLAVDMAALAFLLAALWWGTMLLR